MNLRQPGPIAVAADVGKVRPDDHQRCSGKIRAGQFEQFPLEGANTAAGVAVQIARRSPASSTKLITALKIRLIANRVRIATLAQSMQLPTMGGWREFVEAGCLMSYGSNIPEQFRRAADFVDRILRGAKPGDIPVEQPTKFELVVDLKTAKALGVDVPLQLQQRADEVIE